jgi:hypothetical protein
VVSRQNGPKYAGIIPDTRRKTAGGYAVFLPLRIPCTSVRGSGQETPGGGKRRPPPTSPGGQAAPKGLRPRRCFWPRIGDIQRRASYTGLHERGIPQAPERDGRPARHGPLPSAPARGRHRQRTLHRLLDLPTPGTHGGSYWFISARNCSAASGGNMDNAAFIPCSERSRAASALSLPTAPTCTPK